jgi:hypothetical protein
MSTTAFGEASELDSARMPRDTRDVRALMTRFANVLDRYTNTYMDAEIDPQAVIDPEAADAIVARGRLLRAIGELEPGITLGPLQAERQRWTRTGTFGDPTPAEAGPPDRDQFLLPQCRADDGGEVKPFGFGLYTSTVTAAGSDMWEMYLEAYRGSTLYPEPWHTWDLELDQGSLSVAEIVSARSWVDFVCAAWSRGRGGVVPDWAAAAERYDAVHVTLPAVAAAQGFRFATPHGSIAPVFWDVECTFWLRWRFAGARQVATGGP